MLARLTHHLLAVLVLPSVVRALTITYPKAGNVVDFLVPFNVTWNWVSTDPVMVRPQWSKGGVYKSSFDDIKTSAGTARIGGPELRLYFETVKPNEDDYQIALTRPSDGALIAQSPLFSNRKGNSAQGSNPVIPATSTSTKTTSSTIAPVESSSKQSTTSSSTRSPTSTPVQNGGSSKTESRTSSSSSSATSQSSVSSKDETPSQTRSTSAISPSSTQSETAIPGKDGNSSQPSGVLSAGAKAGVGVGAVAGVSVLALIAFLLLRIRKRRAEKNASNTSGEDYHGKPELAADGAVQKEGVNQTSLIYDQEAAGNQSTAHELSGGSQGARQEELVDSAPRYELGARITDFSDPSEHYYRSELAATKD